MKSVQQAVERSKRAWRAWLCLGAVACLGTGAMLANQGIVEAAREIVLDEIDVPEAVEGVQMGEGEDDGKSTGQFTLPRVNTDVQDQLSDINRYAAAKAWDKAFNTLSKVKDAKPKGMVGGDGGWWVPYDEYIWGTLANLDAEGRRAFRLFHDAKAKSLLSKADLEAPVSPEKEIAALQELFDNYFITSVGAQGADRLANTYFERGMFEQAARCWRSVLEYHPDSDLSLLWINVKQGIALSRLGQWDELDRIARAVENRYKGQKVRIGGKEVEAGPYLRQLLQDRPAADSASASAENELPARIKLPKGDEPIWQFEVIDQETQDALNITRQQYGGRGDVGVPPVANDGKRVYMNWLGVVFALDIETGKMAWRDGKFSDLVKNYRNYAYRINPPQYSVAAGNGNVFAVTIAPARLNQWQEPFRLVCYDAKTGKEKWNSSKGARAKEFNFYGQPELIGGTLYAAAYPKQKAELHLFAFDAETGAEKWMVPLGTPQGVNSNYYGMRAPSPTMTPYGQDLLVLTNSGSLMMVDVERQTLRWAYSYNVSPQQVYDPWSGYNYTGGSETDGAAVVRDGVLYFKDRLGTSLTSLDLSSRKVLWDSRKDEDLTIVGLDDEWVYMMEGNDISPYHRKTGKVGDANNQLSEAGAFGLAWRGPVRTRESLYIFTPRGIYEFEKKSGDLNLVIRGSDIGSRGGLLWKVGDRLISISDLRITAYPTQP